jgi:glycosyltransferase involved in cell wall biosynthesis
MKIGMLICERDGISVNHVIQSTIAALQQEHDLIYYPPDYLFQTKASQKDMIKDMLLSSDAILGYCGCFGEDMALQIRQDLNQQIPYFCLMLGFLPRGNGGMMKNYHLFRTTDVLLVNCSGDLEIGNNFFENAKFRLLPFAFAESDFYPLDEGSKQALRATLGFNSEEKILFYSGRITLEKNVHSILKIFSVIQKLVPNTRLIVAGGSTDKTFWEFGAHTPNISGTLEKLVAKLGIDRDKVRFVGHKERRELCGLYNIADVVINMTLHHDENFGLSQVEAMACGTPVIGTNWGGLKDTIVDGETGYKVSTIVTGLGIKLNWWEAVEKIVTLLNNDSEYIRLCQQCVDIARKKYSLSQYRQTLRAILAESHEKADIVIESLRATEFARQVWSPQVRPLGKQFGTYTSDVSAYNLYKELITPYTGTSQDSVAIDKRLKANNVLCLAAPLIEIDEELFEIDDPIFPLSISIPAEHKNVINTVIDAMREQSSITVERLANKYLAGQTNIADALEWMIEAGLILKGGLENDILATGSVGNQMSLPMFSYQKVNLSSDILVMR